MLEGRSRHSRTFGLQLKFLREPQTAAWIPSSWWQRCTAMSCSSRPDRSWPSASSVPRCTRLRSRRNGNRTCTTRTPAEAGNHHNRNAERRLIRFPGRLCCREWLSWRSAGNPISRTATRLPEASQTTSRCELEPAAVAFWVPSVNAEDEREEKRLKIITQTHEVNDDRAHIFCWRTCTM